MSIFYQNQWRRWLSSVLAAAILVCMIPAAGAVDPEPQQTAAPAGELRFDYHKIRTVSGGSVPVQEVTSFEQTTVGSEEEINPEVGVETEPWHFIATDSANYKYGDKDSGMRIKLEQGQYYQVKIRVREEGTYQTLSETMQWQYGPTVKIYLAPGGAENLLDEQYALGKVDTFAPDNANVIGKLTELGVRTLAAGDYVLSYQCVGRNASSRDWILLTSAFILKKVAVEDFRFDYNKIRTVSGGSVPVQEVTNFEQTTMGSGKEINPEVGVETEPWHFIATDSANYKYGDKDSGMRIKLEKEQFYQLKIRVKEEGTYQTLSETMQWQYGPTVKLYLAPDGAENPLDEQYALGKVDTFAPDNANVIGKLTELGVRTLAAGDYVLSYRCVGRNASSRDWILLTSAFILRRASQQEDIRLFAEELGQVPLGGSTSTQLGLTVNGVEADMTRVESLNAISNDDSIAAAYVQFAPDKSSAQLVVEGKGAGETKITVTAAIGGNEYSIQIDVQCVAMAADELRFDYHKIRTVSGGSIPVQEVTSFEQTTMGSGEEINPEVGVKTEPWHFIATDSANYKYGDKDSGMRIKLEKEQFYQLKIRVREEGTYQTLSETMQWQYGPTVKLYLAPDGAENPLDEQYALGEVDTFAPDSANIIGKLTKLDVRTLAAGDYVLSYQCVGRNASSRDWILLTSAFILRREGQQEDIRFYAGELGQVPLGGIAATKLGLTVDGIEESLERVDSLSAASDDESIATARVQFAQDKASARLIVEGKSTGETMITVTAVIGENEYSAQVSVRCAPKPVSELRFDYNKIRTSSGGSIPVQQVTTFEQTTLGSEEEINPEVGIETEPWHFASTDSTNFKYGNADTGMRIVLSKDQYYQLKIRVREDGVYQTISETMQWQYGPTVKLYLAPDGAEDPMDEQYALDQVDTYAPDNANVPGKRTELGVRTLAAGDYVLSYQCVGRNASSRDWVLLTSSFMLKKVVSADLRFDYNKVRTSASDSGQCIPIEQIKSFGQTTIGAEEEIGPALGIQTEPWCFVSTDSNDVQYFGPELGWRFIQATDDETAFRIRVQKAGTYQAVSENLLYQYGPIVEVFLAPDGAEDPTDPRYSLGSMDLYAPDDANITQHKTSLGTVSLSAGDYTLTYRTIGRNASSRDWAMTTTAFILRESQKEELRFFVGSLKPIPLGGAASAALGLTVNGVQESLARIESLSVVSADESIAVAHVQFAPDKSTAQLVVEGKSVGATVIEVSAVIDGTVYSAQVNARCAPLKELREVLLSLDRDVLQVGGQAAATARAVLIDDSVEVPESVYFESTDAAVATVDNRGAITARNQGKAQIVAYITWEGQTMSAKREMTVTGNSPLQSLRWFGPKTIALGGSIRPVLSGKLANGYTAPLDRAQITYQIQSGDAVTAEADGTIRGMAVGSAVLVAAVTLDGVTVSTEPYPVTVRERGETDQRLSFSENGNPADATLDKQGWELVDKNAQAAYEGGGLRLTVEPDTELLIRFRVDADGAYLPEIIGAQGPEGAQMLVYIDQGFAGRADFYASETADDVVFPLNSLYLTQGDHTLTLRSESGKGGSAYFKSLILRAAGESLPKAERVVVKAPSTLCVGESAPVNTRVIMDNGAVWQFGPEEQAEDRIELSISDERVLTLENGAVRAVTPGSGQIRADAYIRGERIEGFCAVTVDRQTLKSLSLRLNGDPIVGNAYPLLIDAKTENGRAINLDDLALTYSSSDAGVATAHNRTLQALGAGQAEITVQGELAGNRAQAAMSVTVRDPQSIQITVGADSLIMKPEAKGIQLYVEGKRADGTQVDLSKAERKFVSENPEIAAVSQTGFVTPISVGDARITVTVDYAGQTLTGSVTVTISAGKTAATFYTPEKVQAARDNVKKYDWARTAAESAVRNAEKYVGMEEKLWSIVTQQSLPRSITVGFRYDPDAYLCRYPGCGEDLRARFGNYPWIIDPLKMPWKIQCPACRRYFPSNDFGSYYQAGLDEHGTFDPEKAKQDGQEYLKNILYPEVDKQLGVTGWGVDDGFGYRTGESYKVSLGNYGSFPESHTYISYYIHRGVWDKTISDALSYTRDAYLYTGEAKYGRVGAILLDRVADVYYDFNIADYFPEFYNADSTWPIGKVKGCEWETYQATNLAKCYDAFYPLYEDPYVINFLAQKAEQYQFENTKTTPSLIRKNSEDNILREIYDSCQNGDINGNFGTHQAALATAAVVLDTMPETKEMIDWVFQSGDYIRPPDSPTGQMMVTGGNVMRELVNEVNRDGFGNEVAPQYNYLHLQQLRGAVEALSGYSGYPTADLYQNPKFRKMLTSQLQLVFCRRASAQIGDSGRCASTDFVFSVSDLMTDFEQSKDPELAQMIYFLNGESVEGLHGSIFSQNPESVQQEIREIIQTQGTFDFDSSELLAGYGLGILRGGGYHVGSGTQETVDNQRDFWMYFGYASGSMDHSHPDCLNLGLHAYGLDMAPDLGYPEDASGSNNYIYWGQGTLNHNLVVVNRQRQPEIGYRGKVIGKPLHFDDAGKVKLMDVDAPSVWKETDIYRRTVVMVEVDDDVSYGVDFFRIRGGNEHKYSFHSLSDEIYETENLSLVTQPMGTYAGPEIPWGAHPTLANSYNWFKNVRRAVQPATGEFAVDFKVKDFRNTLGRGTDPGLHLRLTMLNDFDLSEVALTTGIPPQIAGNPKSLEFLFATRTGTNLDSLFTTVLEPYDGERYVDRLEQVPVELLEGAPGSADTVKAVKVTLKSGRVDYIVYATNNRVLYRVDDAFDFRGFVGVCSLGDSGPVYSYINDGDVLGNVRGTAAYEGKVVNFTKELSSENTIEVQFQQPVDVDALVGRHVYIENQGSVNATYPILSAQTESGRNVTLNIGDITTIQKFKDDGDWQGGYIYTFSEGQKVRVPLSTVRDDGPVFVEQQGYTVTAGSKLSFAVRAHSPAGKELSYSTESLPRGASFDPKSQVFTWTPDGAQIGRFFACFHVSDGVSSATQYVPITVNRASVNPTPQPPRPVTPPVVTPPDGPDSTDNSGKPVELEAAADADGTARPDAQKILQGVENEKSIAIRITGDDETEIWRVELPAQALAGGGTIEVITPGATVRMPGNLLTEDQVQGKSTATLVIGANGISLLLDGQETSWSGAYIWFEFAYSPQAQESETGQLVVRGKQGELIANGRYLDGKMGVWLQSLPQTLSVEYRPVGFDDLGGYGWAEPAILRLAARDIVKGVGEGRFAPAKNVTRADFVVLLVRALDLGGQAGDSFADVAPQAYYSREVGIAKALGIVNGKGENRFYPQEPISRQDMMVIVARALPLAKYTLAAADAKDLQAFSDIEDLADYATAAAATLSKNQIVAGSGGKLMPQAFTTRAEIAVLIDRILFLDRLQPSGGSR